MVVERQIITGVLLRALVSCRVAQLVKVEALVKMEKEEWRGLRT